MCVCVFLPNACWPEKSWVEDGCFVKKEREYSRGLCAEEGARDGVYDVVLGRESVSVVEL
jgi:hypothetical protein